MLKTILKDPTFRGLRVLIIISVLLSFVTFFYETLSFTCQLAILQNVLLPIIVVQQYISKMSLKLNINRVRSGAILGGLIGGSVALFDSLLQMLQYYFLGDKELAAWVTGIGTTENTMKIFYIEIYTNFVIWLGLTILSIISGLLASLFVTTIQPGKPVDQ